MVDYGAGYGYGGGGGVPSPYGRSPRFRRTGAQPYGAGGDTSGYGGNGTATAYDAPAPQSSYSEGRWGGAVNQPHTPAAPGGYEGYGAGNAFIGPGGAFSGNQGVGAVIPDFYRQGAFDPSGGGAYLDAIKAELGAREQSDVAQAGLTSDLYGGDDPLSRMYGRLTAEQGARNRYPALIAQARAQMAAQRQQEIYGLLGQRLGNIDYYHQPKTDYGAIAGDVLGTAAGGIVGNLTGGGKKKKGSG